MHPEIALFPSQTFYDGKLQNGPNMAELTRQPWHQYELMRPFKFFSTKAPESPGRLHSIINKEEANVALALYERLRVDYPSVDFDYRIGIVTMYKAQVFELRRTFQNRYGQDIAQRIDFNTVDGFQGQEKDIIILSCVRSSVEPRSIGFLSDRRRLNVAVTRAKSNLFIIGNAEHLKRSDTLWHTLVTTAEKCGALQTVTVSLLQKGIQSQARSQAFIKQSGGPDSMSPVAIPKKAVPLKPAMVPKPEPLPARKLSVSIPSQRGTTAASKTSSSPRGGDASPIEPKRKSIALDDDPIARKKAKADPSSDDFVIVEEEGPSIRSSPAQAKRTPSKPKSQVTPMKPPRLSNGAAKPSPSGSKPVHGKSDPVGNLSVGVLKRPPTPTGAPNTTTASDDAGVKEPRRRAASPTKPSSAALDALFVKKRR